MGLRQEFRFKFQSPDEVREFLHGLGGVTPLEKRTDDFFVFSQSSGRPEFTFDCELTTDGLRSDRVGEYFAFLGIFVESLSGHFGAVTVVDA